MARSLQEISMLGYARPLGKISVGDLCTISLDKLSLRSILARSLQDIFAQALCKRSLRGLLTGLCKRSVDCVQAPRNIPEQAPCNSSVYKRSLYQLSVQEIS